MMTIANPVQSLAANLGAFMLNGAGIKSMPCGVFNGEAAFVNPSITSVLDCGKKLRTLEWRPCEVDPIIRVVNGEEDSYVEIDKMDGRSETWNRVRAELRGTMSMASSNAKKTNKKKAKQYGALAVGAADKAAKIQSRIDAAKQLSDAMQNASGDMTWRAAKFGVSATSNVRGSEEGVKEHSDTASTAHVRSGVYYLLGDVLSQSANQLSHASEFLFTLGRFDEAAIWSEVAWQLSPETHAHQAEVAVKGWLAAAAKRTEEGKDLCFELSRALQDAWLARYWDGYADAMVLLAKQHEGRDDYAGVAADYVRIAWGLLQSKSVSPLAMRRAVRVLNDAQTAWELAEQDDLSVAAKFYAKRAEAIAVG